MLMLLNQWIDEFYVVQERRTTDREAPKLWKGSSGLNGFLTQLITILKAPNPEMKRSI